MTVHSGSGAHTPGQWCACDNASTIIITTTPGINGSAYLGEVAAVYKVGPHAEADARLIAAAPTMFEALRKIAALDADWNDSGIRAGTFRDGLATGHEEAASIARAAIAKAEV